MLLFFGVYRLFCVGVVVENEVRGSSSRLLIFMTRVLSKDKDCEEVER